LRGTGSTKEKPGCVILEEAAHFSVHALMCTIIPTLTRRHISCFMISTRASSRNFYDKLLEIIKDDGRPLFRSYIYELVCKSCKAKGEEIACQHELGELPHWLSKENVIELGKVMEDHAADFAAELLGAQKDLLVCPAFNKDLLGSIPTHNFPDLVFSDIAIGVDPGSSDNADYAIVSIATTPSNDVVVRAKRKKNTYTHIRTHNIYTLPLFLLRPLFCSIIEKRKSRSCRNTLVLRRILLQYLPFFRLPLIRRTLTRVY